MSAVAFSAQFSNHSVAEGSAWYAVVPAAGSGTRMGAVAEHRSKVLLPIKDNLCALELSLTALAESGVLKGVCVATRAEEKAVVEELIAGAGLGLDVQVIEGGSTRQESVFLGLEAVRGRATQVMVHDAARPLVAAGLVKEVALRAEDCGAAILAVPVASTVKRVVGEGVVAETVDRSLLWEAQTPQAFSFELLWEAHCRGKEAGVVGTDDAQLVEMLGKEVFVVRGDEVNQKITTEADLAIVRALLA